MHVFIDFFTKPCYNIYMDFLPKPADFPDTIPYMPFFVDDGSMMYAIKLFEKCNLRCCHCFEAHADDGIDMRYIHDIPSMVQSHLMKLAENRFIKTVKFHIWGGEPFMDSLDDTMFREYDVLCRGLVDAARKALGSPYIRFVWTSNGVFSNTERVVSLLGKEYGGMHGEVTFSYDPVGRFKTEAEEQTMVRNFRAFHDLGLCNAVSITLTKPNIVAYVSGKSRLGEFRSVRIEDGCYTPNQNVSSLMPTSTDILCFLLWCERNGFDNVDMLEGCRSAAKYEKAHRRCMCRSEFQVSPAGITSDCSRHSPYFRHEDFFGDVIVSEKNVNDVSVSMGMEKVGCMECEFLPYCQCPCWIAELYAPSDGSSSEIHDFTSKRQFCPFKVMQTELRRRSL